nr:ubiquitin-related modifier 1 isoform X1 [Kogia breviceps]
MAAPLSVEVEFGGGAELLFDGVRKHRVTLPGQEAPWDIRNLLVWIKKNLLKERPELFIQGDSVRPGILVLINDADWELLVSTSGNSPPSTAPLTALEAGWGQTAPGRQDGSPLLLPSLWKSWDLSACNSWPWANKRLGCLLALPGTSSLETGGTPHFPQPWSLVQPLCPQPRAFRTALHPKREQGLKARLSRL